VTKEVSDRDESYSTCHHVFMQKAQSIGNLSSKMKTEEANAASNDGKGKGKGGKGKGKGKGKGRGKGEGGRGGGRGGKGDGSAPERNDGTYYSTACNEFLKTGACKYGEKCYHQHFTVEELLKLPRLKSTKKKKGDKPKEKKEKKKKSKAPKGNESDSSNDGKQSKKGKKPCFAFKRTGACPDGSKCKYSHASDDDDDEDSSLLECDDTLNMMEGSEDISECSNSDDDHGHESILSAAVIEIRGNRKRTPIKGGLMKSSIRSTKQNEKKTRQKLSFAKSVAEVPYHSGTARWIEGRKYEIGENVEIKLPGRTLNGIRCLVIELWETEESVPYAKLKPLLKKEVSKNELRMLTKVGIRV